jgi:hypothetical protein
MHICCRLTIDRLNVWGTWFTCCCPLSTSWHRHANGSGHIVKGPLLTWCKDSLNLHPGWDRFGPPIWGYPPFPLDPCGIRWHHESFYFCTLRFEIFLPLCWMPWFNQPSDAVEVDFHGFCLPPPPSCFSREGVEMTKGTLPGWSSTNSRKVS